MFAIFRTCITPRIIALIFALFGVQARAELWPELKTDAQRMQYLLWVHEHFPELFKNIAAHDYDIFSILETQQKINEQLAENRDYRAATKKSRKYHTFSVVSEDDRIVTASKVNPERIAQWQQGLVDVLGELNPENPGADLDVKIKDRIQAVERSGVGNPAGAIIALVDTVQVDAARKQHYKEQLFTMESIEDQIAYLKTLKVPESPAEHGLKPRSLGVDDPKITRDALYESILKAAPHLNEIERLASLRVMLQDPNGDVSGTRDEIEQRIREFGESNIDGYLDKKVLEKRLAKVISSKSLASLVRARLSNAAEDITKDKVATESKFSGKLVIKEVPPQLAVWRGQAGDDCATSLSFPYPNSPFEKVFFLYDGEGKLLGYAAGTIKMAGRNKTLVLHTVNGSTISPSDIPKLFHGLHQARETLGVQSVHLPHPDKLQGLINREDLREVVHDIASKGKVAKLKDADASIRTILDEHSEMEYDRVGAHAEARTFEPDVTELDNLKTEAKVEKWDGDFTHPLDTERVYQLAIELGSAGRDTDAVRVAGAVGISESELRTHLDVIQNPRKLPTSEYEKAVNAGFAKQGIDPGDLRRKNSHLYEHGYIYASDAFHPEHLKHNIGFIQKMLSRDSDLTNEMLDHLHSNRASLRRFSEMREKVAAESKTEADSRYKYLNRIAKLGLFPDLVLQADKDSHSTRHDRAFNTLDAIDPATDAAEEAYFWEALKIAKELGEPKNALARFLTRRGRISGLLMLENPFGAELRKLIFSSLSENPKGDIAKAFPHEFLLDPDAISKRYPKMSDRVRKMVLRDGFDWQGIHKDEVASDNLARLFPDVWHKSLIDSFNENELHYKFDLKKPRDVSFLKGIGSLSWKESSKLVSTLESEARRLYPGKFNSRSLNPNVIPDRSLAERLRNAQRENEVAHAVQKAHRQLAGKDILSFLRTFPDSVLLEDLDITRWSSGFDKGIYPEIATILETLENSKPLTPSQQEILKLLLVNPSVQFLRNVFMTGTEGKKLVLENLSKNPEATMEFLGRFGGEEVVKTIEEGLKQNAAWKENLRLLIEDKDAPSEYLERYLWDLTNPRDVALLKKLRSENGGEGNELREFLLDLEAAHKFVILKSNARAPYKIEEIPPEILEQISPAERHQLEQIFNRKTRHENISGILAKLKERQPAVYRKAFSERGVCPDKTDRLMQELLKKNANSGR